MLGDHLPEERYFVTLPPAKHGVGDVQRQQTLVDHPGIRFDFSAAQIVLQLSRFVYGSRFGKGDNQHTRKVGITQARQKLCDGFWQIARLAQHFACR